MTRLEEIKNRKPFAVWDLLVYGILVAVIIILFAVFVFGGKNTAKGIEVLYGNERIYTYEYGKGGTVSAGWEAQIEEREDGETLLVTVKTGGDGSAYNVIAIDLKNKVATMRDANCYHKGSYHKGCVHMPDITSENGVIVCVPHGLKVIAFGAQEDVLHPSVG